MASEFPLLLPGVRAAGQREVCAPFDGTPLARVETADAAGASQALATASALARDRDAWLSPARRIEILHGVAERMQQCRDELSL